MNLKVPVDYLQELKTQFNIVPDDSKHYANVFGGMHYLRSGDKKEIPITSFTAEWLDAIVEMAARPSEELTSRKNMAAAILRTVKQYKLFKSDPVSAVPRTLLDVVEAMKEYIATGANRWLFREHSDGYWLPYFVTKIEYTPPHVSYGYRYPAYVTLKMASKNSAEECRWYKQDLIGRPAAAELLERKGLRLETEEAVEIYLASFERYKKLSVITGAQYLASGFGEMAKTTKSYRWDYETFNTVSLTKEGQPSRVVMDDVFATQNADKETSGRSANRDRWSGQEKEPDGMTSASFWETSKPKKSRTDGSVKIIQSVEDDDWDEEDEHIEIETEFDLEVFKNSGKVPLPYYPYVTVFDLIKHMFVKTHISNLQEYPYDTKVIDKLILPEEQKQLLSILIGGAGVMLEDIIQGKSGGVIIISTGPPGVGKSLTSEVYCEMMQKPYYTVQCSQLGLTPTELESNLADTLKKAQRWGAILTLDEADVFVRERGEDINQNAIVGIFLRILEYFKGVLIMTSNRATVIDDAILSRATAHIRYDYPDTANLKLIWKVLSESVTGKAFDKDLINALVKRFPKLSGRSVKQLLKLSAFCARSMNTEIDFATVESIAQFQNIEDRDSI
jgi:hypothetical protein